jgi:small-conductance mechanosensitive channel
MNDLWNRIGEMMTGDVVSSILRASLILAGGLLLATLVGRRVGRFAEQHADAQSAMLTRRAVFYVLLGLTVVSVLHQFNFRLSALLGAAGILSVALGFASQTSASNLISGLFLLGERAFSVGDVIRIGDTTGEVLSIDLLSIKLRTFDNLFVRVPNENMIKTQVTNMTRFPIRRYDLQIGVAYKEDISRVREILLEVAYRDPLCLAEPIPLIIFQGYGDSSLNLQLSVWAARENFLAMRNAISETIKRRFDDEGIEIPFPHRSLYAGSKTEAFPVRVVSDCRPADASG